MGIYHHLSHSCGHHQALTDLTSFRCYLHQHPLGQEPHLRLGLCPQSWLELKYHACLQPCAHLQDGLQICVICSLLPSAVTHSFPFDPDWSPCIEPGPGWSFPMSGTADGSYYQPPALPTCSGPVARGGPLVWALPLLVPPSGPSLSSLTELPCSCCSQTLSLNNIRQMYLQRGKHYF